MTKLKEPSPEIAPETESWESELERVGFVRRIFLARRWYGADWWFVTIASVMVIAFIVIAFVPGWFAPYAPDAIVGPRFLAPGEHPAVPVLIVPVDSPVNELKDLAVPPDQPRPNIGVVQGVPTGGALNEQAQAIDGQIKNEPQGLRLRPRINRYANIEEALQAVANGTDQAAVIQSTEWESQGLATQFPPRVVSFWEPMTSARTFSVACCGGRASP